MSPLSTEENSSFNTEGFCGRASFNWQSDCRAQACPQAQILSWQQKTPALSRGGRER